MGFTDLKLSKYTDKSIVVQGDTRKYKEDLKKLGGKYNSGLKNGPGWIFPIKIESEVANFISDGKRLVTDVEVKEGEERSQLRTKELVEKQEIKSQEQYTILIDLIKNISNDVNRINQAISIIMSDEQKKNLDILNKKSTTKKVAKNTKLTFDDESSDEDKVPYKRLLK